MEGLEHRQGASIEPLPGPVRHLVERPWLAVLAFCLLQSLAWTLLPFLTSSAPPLDTVENFIWGKEWLLGTHKHPPLPSWLAEAGIALTGETILSGYIISQICVALTYIFAFATALRLTSPRNALVATLLLAGVYYFTWPSTELNHNVVQMPVWAAAIYCFTRAREAPGTAAPWLALGVTAGIGIYAKYSVVVLYALFLAWIAIEKPLRRSLATPWPWLGGVVSVLVAAPHLAWLATSEVSPIAYAQGRAGDEASLLGTLKWIAAQGLDHLPMAVILLAAGPKLLSCLPRRDKATGDLAYVAFFAIGPAVLTVLISLGSDMGLRDMWGAPMFSLSGLLVVLLLSREWSPRAAARTAVAAALTVTVLAVAYAVSIPVSTRVGKAVRPAWPMHEIAARAGEAWAAESDTPLRIVSGAYGIAGLVAAGAPERLEVLFLGRPELSPWLSPQEVARDGVLYLWQTRHGPEAGVPESARLDFTGTFTVGENWARPLEISYGGRLPEPPGEPRS